MGFCKKRGLVAIFLWALLQKLKGREYSLDCQKKPFCDWALLRKVEGPSRQGSNCQWESSCDWALLEPQGWRAESAKSILSVGVFLRLGAPSIKSWRAELAKSRWSVGVSTWHGTPSTTRLKGRVGEAQVASGSPHVTRHSLNHKVEGPIGQSPSCQWRSPSWADTALLQSPFWRAEWVLLVRILGRQGTPSKSPLFEGPSGHASGSLCSGPTRRSFKVFSEGPSGHASLPVLDAVKTTSWRSLHVTRHSFNHQVEGPSQPSYCGRRRIWNYWKK